MGCGNVNTLESEKLEKNYNNQDSEPNINKNQEKKVSDKNVPQNIDNITKQKNKEKKRKKKEKMRQDMKEYQKIIKRKRKFLNKNGEYEDSEDTDDSRLQYAKGKNLGKKRKVLSLEEIEDGIKQDQKEEEKRKGRKAYFSPMKKEVPFKHKESEGPYDPSSSKPYSLGYENEMYRDINYGKPIRLYNQTWLTYDAPVEPDIYGPRVQIPPGWRRPTLDDYKKLFKFVGNNEKLKIFLTHERLLNMKTEYQYITSDKVFPDDNNGYSSKAWAYFCIGFNFYDEVEYPGIEPLVDPNKKKKIINIKQEEIINTNSNESINKEKYEDAIVSDDEEDDFIRKINKQLNKNREDHAPIDENYIRNKKRLFTPNFKDDSIFKQLNEENDKKNKFLNKKKLDDEENEEEKNSEIPEEEE